MSLQHKIGDSVTITCKINHHGFIIGKDVIITNIDRDDSELPYRAVGKSHAFKGRSVSFWIGANECVTSTALVKGSIRFKKRRVTT